MNCVTNCSGGNRVEKIKLDSIHIPDEKKGKVKELLDGVGVLLRCWYCKTIWVENESRHIKKFIIYLEDLSGEPIWKI